MARVGFTNFAKLVDSIESAGKYHRSIFSKTTSVSTALSQWRDISSHSGYPKANFYIGTQFESTIFSTNYAIYTGPSIPSTSKRILHKATLILTINSVSLFLLDYLMFYPLLDTDDTAQQDLDNIVTLPRYTTGEGVRAMLVWTSSHTGNMTATITYTNSAGVSGRTASLVLSNSGVAGTIASGVVSGLTNCTGPFFPLASGDIGVRSVESILFSAPGGGLCSLVLVKPIVNFGTLEAGTAREIDFIIERSSAPVIEDGACLNFIGLCPSSYGGQQFIGELDFTWS